MNQYPQQNNYPQSSAPKPTSNSKTIILVVLSVLVGTCGLCGVLGIIGNLIEPKKESSPQIATTTPQNSPIISPSPTTKQEIEKEKEKPEETKKSSKNSLDEYRKLVTSINSKGDIIEGVNEGLTPDQIKITVSNSWHYEPYQIRLQVAQKLWEAWAGLHSPDEPDKARIKLVDLNGNEVGGSRVWAGSLIWVKEDN